MRFVLTCMLLAFTVPALGQTPQEPLVSKEQACTVALEYNKKEFMAMRDKFVEVATSATVLHERLDQTKAELERIKGQLEEEKGRRILKESQQP